MKLNRRTTFVSAGIASAIYGLWSCRGSRDDVAFVVPRLATHLYLGPQPAASETPLPAASSLWRHDDLALSLAGQDSITELRDALQGSTPVMVRFARGSLLGEQLRSDPLTLAYYPAVDAKKPGHALVAVPDELVLDGLASAAHAANAHACGNLELLSLTTVSQPSVFTPPVFDEIAKLDAVTTMLSAPTAAKIGATVATLEGMGTRFHNSTNGVAASTKVFELFTNALANKLSGATISYVSHNDAAIPTSQKSVVVTLPGTEDNDTTIVIGAHLDSINGSGANKDAPAPGADDNASGIATLAEMLRVMANSGVTFKRRIELHAYAAEEVGLVGSKDIATKYAAAGRKIAAMMQIDMNSWSVNSTSKTIYLVENDTNRVLRRSLKDLMWTYLGGDFVEKSLPAGTSDHKSWYERGFPAVFPFEDPQNHNLALHTVNDTSTTANNLELSTRFAQLGIAFLAHHAGLVAATTQYDQRRTAAKASLVQDLKLAILAGSHAGSYAIYASAPENTADIHLCKIAQAGALGCIRERLQTESDKTASGRTYRKGNTQMELAENDRLAVFGYDADQKLIAYRSVRLQKK